MFLERKFKNGKMFPKRNFQNSKMFPKRKFPLLLSPSRRTEKDSAASQSGKLRNQLPLAN